MSSFQVVPAELALAGGMIGSAATVLQGAETAAASAGAMAGAFGGEAIEGAFVSACGRATRSVYALSETVQTLSDCVRAASEGYLVTDHGIIQAGGVPGAVTPAGRGGPAPLSPTWSRP